MNRGSPESHRRSLASLRDDKRWSSSHSCFTGACAVPTLGMTHRPAGIPAAARSIISVRVGEAGDGLEISCKGHHSSRCLAPVEKFIRRVITVLRQGEPEEHHRALENLFHVDDRADRAAFADENRPRPNANFRAPFTASANGPFVGAL